MQYIEVRYTPSATHGWDESEKALALTHHYLSNLYHISEENKKNLMSLHQKFMLFQSIIKYMFLQNGPKCVYRHVFC